MVRHFHQDDAEERAAARRLEEAERDYAESVDSHMESADSHRRECARAWADEERVYCATRIVWGLALLAYGVLPCLPFFPFALLVAFLSFRAAVDPPRSPPAPPAAPSVVEPTRRLDNGPVRPTLDDLQRRSRDERERRERERELSR